MKLLTGITLTYLIITINAQGFDFGQQYFPQFRSSSSDSIYFPQESIQPNKDVLEQIFGPPPKQNNVVEIEKSNEISATTTIEHVPARLSTAVSNIPVTPQYVPNREQAPKVPNRQAVHSAAVSPSPVQPEVQNQGYNGLLYSVTNFGVHLLKNINAMKTGNIVTSPYSITSLLALLQQGATGQTQDQITAALQMTSKDSASAYSQISANYKSRNTRNILRTANNVFVGETFVINKDFKKIAQRSFDSDITPVSFGKSDKAAGQINNWVASKTNNKIDRLISPDALDSTTQLVLVNAVYFKGLWEVPFRADATLPREFHLGNGQLKIAPFMRTRRPLNAGMDPTTNAKVVLLPFERNEYTLMVILPSVLEGISGTLRSLTDARLMSYLSFLPADIELELPKFTVRSDTNLAPVLRNMGITKMFGPYAELEGLGTYRAFTPQISSAVHSAVLSIDEQGGSAAAATSFAAVALSYDDPATLIRIDRPFIAILWDTTTSLPLFMAKIEDPAL